MIRIVIAEDQALVLGALAALLSLESDLEVVGQAQDGAAALEAVRRLRPDVLVSDIEMPIMTGLELARAVKAEGLGARIVMVTTFGRPGYLREALETGVKGYLLKDSPAEVLAEAIREVAGGRRVIARELAEAAWDVGSNPLSERERSVLRLAEAGRSNKEIARRLGLAPGTVRNQLSEASAKLGAAGRIEAGRIARDKGWL